MIAPSLKFRNVSNFGKNLQKIVDLAPTKFEKIGLGRRKYFKIGMAKFSWKENHEIGKYYEEIITNSLFYAANF